MRPADVSVAGWSARALGGRVVDVDGFGRGGDYRWVEVRTRWPMAVHLRPDNRPSRRHSAARARRSATGHVRWPLADATSPFAAEIGRCWPPTGHSDRRSQGRRLDEVAIGARAQGTGMVSTGETCAELGQGGFPWTFSSTFPRDPRQPGGRRAQPGTRPGRRANGTAGHRRLHHPGKGRTLAMCMPADPAGEDRCGGR
jgi:hypothetical protein